MYSRSAGKPQPRKKTRSGEPYRDEQKKLEQLKGEVRLKSGEVYIYGPPHYQGDRLPAVSLGRFGDGTPVLNFRIYRREALGVYIITSDGASFTLAEFRKIVMLVNDLVQSAPELAEYERRESK